jgi:flagellar basal body P-ring formation protein FlgA
MPRMRDPSLASTRIGLVLIGILLGGFAPSGRSTIDADDRMRSLPSPSTTSSSPPRSAAQSKREMFNGSTDQRSVMPLRLKPNAWVDEPWIRLGDIAEPAIDSLPDWIVLESIQLADASEGFAARWRPEDVDELVASRLPSGCMVLWSGSSSVDVQYGGAKNRSTSDAVNEKIAFDTAENRASDQAPSPTAMIAAQRASAALSPAGPSSAGGPVSRDAIVSGSTLEPWQERQLQVVLRQWQESLAKQGLGAELLVGETASLSERWHEVKQILAVRSEGKKVEGPVQWVARCVDREGAALELPIAMNLRALPMAVAVVRTMQRDELITARDVELRPVPIDDDAIAYYQDVADVIGMASRRSISSGRLLQAVDIAPPVVIRRGDLVEIQVVAEDVMVSVMGRAMEDGGDGDLIQLEQSDTRKRLIASVAGPGLALIRTEPNTRNLR